MCSSTGHMQNQNIDDGMEDCGRRKEIRMDRRDILGRGGYGKVFMGQYKSQECAVKRIEIDVKKKKKNFAKELEIIKSLRHENVVHYLSDDEDKDFYYIAMELCKCSMSDYFKEHGYGATKDNMLLIRIMYQCASGVEYLHESTEQKKKKIMHKDIKPANILLSENSKRLLTVKLADFGMGKILDASKSSTATSALGTYGYNSPEVELREKKINLKTDIFSLGIVFHEFSAKGKHPFGGGDRLLAVTEIKDESKKPDLTGVATKPLRGLIANMLEYRPNKRPTAKQVLIGLRNAFVGNNDQLGKAIESSSLFKEKSIPDDGSKDLLADVCNAEYQFEHTISAEPSLQAAPVTSNDECRSPPPKRHKNEGHEKKSRRVAKTTAEKIEQLITNYKVPKSMLKSCTPDAHLRNAEFSIRRKKWKEAHISLDSAIKLLEPMGSVKAQDLFDMAKRAVSEHHLYVMSVLFNACSASQYRKEKLAKDGAFYTGKCVFEIYDVTKNALPATDAKELEGTNVRYKEIGKYFVIPLVARECEKLKQFSKHENLQRDQAVKNCAFADTWFSVLLNKLNHNQKAAEIAEQARKQIESYTPDQHETYARLLHVEGVAKTKLKKHVEARELLNKAMTTVKTYKLKIDPKYIEESIKDNELRSK